MKGVVAGSLFAIAMRWVDRLIGLISTLILARLLAPDDFGIIAMASILVGLVNVVFDLGVNLVLIQNPAPTREDYDTAWTLRLLQSIASALLVAAAAPLGAQYFNEPRLTIVIQVLALSFVVRALENIGIVDFQKNMEFGKDFQFVVARRILTFVVTILSAWFLRSYWALVVGTLAGGLIGAVLSYAMHPMRPRFGLARFREIFGVSQWHMVRNFGGFLSEKMHQIVVGGRENAAVVGGYTLADELSSMPTTELVAPLNRVLLPAFVRVAGDLAELKRVFLLSQAVQTMVAFPAGVGLALVASEAVPFLLGSKWLFVVPYVQVLAPGVALLSLSSGFGYLLMTLGRNKEVAGLSWLSLALFVFFAYLVFPAAGAMEIAGLRVAVGSVWLALNTFLVVRALNGLRYIDIAIAALRPLVAVVLMAGAILALHAAGIADGTLLLVAKIALGALVYASAVVALWHLAGRPDGAERFLLDNVVSKVMAKIIRPR